MKNASLGRSSHLRGFMCIAGLMTILLAPADSEASGSRHVLPTGQEAFISKLVQGPLEDGWRITSIAVGGDGVRVMLRRHAERAQMELLHPSTSGRFKSKHFSVHVTSITPGTKIDGLRKALVERIQTRDRDGPSPWVVATPGVKRGLSDFKDEGEADSGWDGFPPLWLLVFVVGLLFLSSTSRLRQMLGVMTLTCLIAISLIWTRDPGLIGAPHLNPVDELIMTCWWLVPVFGVMWVSARIPRRVLIEVGCVFALALIARLAAPAGVLNQYSEYKGALGVTSYHHMGSGFTGIYQAINEAIPLSGSGVLSIQTVVSALGVVFWFLAMRRDPVGHHSERRWTKQGAWLFAILLALDPVHVRIGTSDAIHVNVFFLTGLVASVFVWYDVLGRVAPMLLCASALLAGVLRGEQAIALAMIPFIFGALKRWNMRELFVGPKGTHAILLIAGGTGIALMLLHQSIVLGQGDGSSVDIADWASFLARHFDPAGPPGYGWWPEHPLADPPPPLFPQAVLYIGMVVVIYALRARKWRVVITALMGFAIFSTRIVSSFAYTRLAEDFADVRYDIITLTLLAMVVAEGLVRLTHGVHGLSTRLTQRPWQRTASTSTIVGTIILICFLVASPYRPPWNLQIAYQREYRFLAEHLPNLAPECAIVVMPSDFVTSRTPDALVSEHVLAHPHSLLVFDQPERRWIDGRRLINRRDRQSKDRLPGGSVQADTSLCHTPCAYFYDGALCAIVETLLNNASSYTIHRPDDLSTWSAFLEQCHALRKASIETVAEETGAGWTLIGVSTPHHFPNRTLTLRLSRLDPRPWSQCPSPRAPQSPPHEAPTAQTTHIQGPPKWPYSRQSVGMGYLGMRPDSSWALGRSVSTAR